MNRFVYRRTGVTFEAPVSGNVLARRGKRESLEENTKQCEAISLNCLRNTVVLTLENHFLLSASLMYGIVFTKDC